MENITIGQVALALGTITVIWTFYSKVIKTINDSLDKKFDPIRKDITMLMKSELSMLEHLETGNHQAAMAKIREEMQTYLVERGK